MASFDIFEVAAGPGVLALSPIPGHQGRYAQDLARLKRWNPGLVLSLTTADEMAAAEAANLRADLAEARIGWQHLPIADFATPDAHAEAAWPEIAARAKAELARGGRVLAHCHGGCGRSGMVLLRLMIEQGEAPGPALARLRKVRPCAVETEAQRAWALAGANGQVR